jgi:hypothetical protein
MCNGMPGALSLVKFGGKDSDGSMTPMWRPTGFGGPCGYGLDEWTCFGMFRFDGATLVRLSI